MGAGGVISLGIKIKGFFLDMFELSDWGCTARYTNLTFMGDERVRDVRVETSRFKWYSMLHVR